MPDRRCDASTRRSTRPDAATSVVWSWFRWARVLMGMGASLFIAPRVAHASDREPFSIGAKPAWYALAGVTTGATTVAHDRGGYLGGEASMVRLSRAGRFCGLYGDGYHDFGARRTYATSGIELGYKFLGLDAGVASRWGDNHIEWGPTGRLFLSLGILSAYGRYAYFADARSKNDAHVVQVGALIKVPLAVWGLQ